MVFEGTDVGADFADHAPPDVSVIVPVYNGSRVIGRCVGSLLAQMTPFDFEIIVVDDGSTDDTLDKIPVFPESGMSCPGRPVVTVLRRSHGGPASARNGGASRASGRVLVFTDADCAARPNWLASLAGPVLSGEADASKGRYLTLQRDIAPRFAQVEFEERYRMLASADSIDFVDTYSMAVKKDLFMDAGGFDTSYPGANNEDVDFSYRLASMGARMIFVDSAAVEHTHPATAVAYGRTKFWRGFWRMRVYRDHPGRMVRDSYTPQILKLQAMAGAVLAMSLVPFIVCAARTARVAIGLAGAFILATAAPLYKVCRDVDPGIGIYVPAMAILRAMTLGLGAALGAVRWKVLPFICRGVSRLLPGGAV